jgi:vacuolar-type H+-ATPase subunit I/STV1
VGIEKMKRVTALVPAEALADFTKQLHRLAVLHVTSIEEDLPEHFQPALTENLESRETSGKLEQVLTFCDGWGAGKRSFLESIFPAKTCATEARIRETAARLNVENLHQRANALSADRDRSCCSAYQRWKRKPTAGVFRQLPPAPGGAKHCG